MTHVVTEACINCKYTDCVVPGPVDCFREGPNILVIDPEECIDCTLCVSVCPVSAIFHEDDVPEKWRHYIDLNAKQAKDLKWPMINIKKAELENANHWATIESKFDLLTQR